MLSSGVQLNVLGPGNLSYRGILHLDHQGTIRHNQTIHQFRLVHNSSNVTSHPADVYDHDGAMCYVVVVVLVYGLSILMLIGSQINKRHDKIIEDKEVRLKVISYDKRVLTKTRLKLLSSVYVSSYKDKDKYSLTIIVIEIV